MLYPLLEKRKKILRDGSIVYRLDERIRIVNGRITDHYEKDLRELSPQVLKKINKLCPESKIVQYRKVFYIVDLLPPQSEYLFLQDKVRYVSVNDKLKDRFFFQQNEDIDEQVSISNNNISLPIEVQEDFGNLSDLSKQKDTEVFIFIDFLSKFPCFAMTTKVGKEIFALIKEKVKSNKIMISENQVFYRSRKCEGNIPWKSSDDLWLAPEGKNGQGRFNVIGVPYLYISEDSAILAKELRLEESELRSTMKIENKSSFWVMDITKEHDVLFELCKQPNDGDEKNTKKYSLPNFVAQCVHYIHEKENVQIDGIKYLSVQDESNCINNYVLFTKNKEDFNVLDFIPQEK